MEPHPATPLPKQAPHNAALLVVCTANELTRFVLQRPDLVHQRAPHFAASKEISLLRFCVPGKVSDVGALVRHAGCRHWIGAGSTRSQQAPTTELFAMSAADGGTKPFSTRECCAM
jgi:hypothetical protein